MAVLCLGYIVTAAIMTYAFASLSLEHTPNMNINYDAVGIFYVVFSSLTMALALLGAVINIWWALSLMLLIRILVGLIALAVAAGVIAVGIYLITLDPNDATVADSWQKAFVAHTIMIGAAAAAYALVFLVSGRLSMGVPLAYRIIYFIIAVGLVGSAITTAVSAYNPTAFTFLDHFGSAGRTSASYAIFPAGAVFAAATIIFVMLIGSKKTASHLPAAVR